MKYRMQYFSRISPRNVARSLGNCVHFERRIRFKSHQKYYIKTIWRTSWELSPFFKRENVLKGENYNRVCLWTRFTFLRLEIHRGSIISLVWQIKVGKIIEYRYFVMKKETISTIINPACDLQVTKKTVRSNYDTSYSYARDINKWLLNVAFNVY